MKLIPFILYSLGILIITSCVNSNHETKTNGTEQELLDEELAEVRHLERVKAITETYDAYPVFETDISYNYTYEYQRLIKEKKRFLVHKFRINDIIQIDSNYLIIAEFNRRRPHAVAEINCTKELFEKLESTLVEAAGNLSDLFLIMDLNNVKKIQFIAKAYNTSEDEGSPITLELENSETFLFQGSLINIIK